jgi:hypothetical protein
MRTLGLLGVAALVVATVLVAFPAAANAHCMEVTPAGGDAVVECNVFTGDFGAGWAGSPLFPGDHPGQGLVPGGPGGIFKMSPSHDGGLITACEALRDSGNQSVSIVGPGGPGCPHGS